MMRNIYKIGLACMSVLVMGCSDFLTESSLDEVRPESVEDLDQLMLGEGYPMNSFFLGYIDLLTDDMENNYPGKDNHMKYLQNGIPAFSWQADMYESFISLNVSNTNTWEAYYEKIKGCNVVLDNIDRVTGKDDIRENLRGQALAMRAYYYFMLVNLYARPYNAEGVDVNTALGVPLILVSAIKDEFPPRTSIAKVYEQVEKDLLTSIPLLDEYGRNNIKYKVTNLFPYVLLSRMYLYMENWEKAGEYASAVIKQRPELLNLSACYTGGENDRLNNVYRFNSPELIWGYSNNTEYNSFSIGPNLGERILPVFQLSAGLLNLYEPEEGANMKDLRLKFYFNSYLSIGAAGLQKLPLNGNKANPAENVDITKGFRVAEMYLNRAESHIRRYLAGGDESLRQAALSDLNYLRQCRYDTRNADYSPVDYSGADLLRFCQDERRRELCFEEHRWFDLRRYGMPELRHEVMVEKGRAETVILSEKSVRYTLPIPKKSMEKNPALVQNP